MKNDVDLSALIACANCDTLHNEVVPKNGARALCVRCGDVLISRRDSAFLRVTLLNVASLILLIAATFTPFLQIGAAGIENASSIFDAALAFTDGALVIVTILSVAMIVFLPMFRMVASIYVVGPLAFDRQPLPKARQLFRLSERFRPWAMAEIFVVGVAVALVKVAGLAHIEFGPAFWMFAALVVINVFSEVLTDTWSVWEGLEAGYARGN